MRWNMKGIDVAKWNLQKDKKGNLLSLDWKKIKADGVRFAIIKVINKQGRKEEGFDLNYNGAISAGLPVDVYNYSYATTVAKAVSDAKIVLSVIKGKKVDTVWLDVEDKCQQNIGVTLLNIIKAYQEVIEEAGYNFGVYTGLSFYNSYIKHYASRIDCPFWIARYYNSYKEMDFSETPLASKKPSILNDLWGWQYTSSGKVDGIAGNVDLNIQYGIEKTKEDKSVEDTGIAEYSLAKDGNRYISTNFKVKEFRCRDGSDSILVDVDFVKDKLQKIRDHFGVPVTINSAYRTAAYNKKVGGASGSYHLKGQAFDIVVKGKTPAEVATYAYRIGIPGIIRYNTFVHVDSRSTKYYARNNNGKVTKLTGF